MDVLEYAIQNQIKNEIHDIYKLSINNINNILDLNYIITGDIIQHSANIAINDNSDLISNDLHFFGHNNITIFNDIMIKSGYTLYKKYDSNQLELFNSKNIIPYITSFYLKDVTAYRYINKDYLEDYYEFNENFGADDRIDSEIILFIINKEYDDYKSYDSIIKNSFINIFKIYLKKDKLIYFDNDNYSEINNYIELIISENHSIEFKNIYFKQYIELLYKYKFIYTEDNINFNTDFKTNLFYSLNNISDDNIKIILAYLWNYFIYINKNLQINNLYLDTHSENSQLIKLYYSNIPIKSVKIPFTINDILINDINDITSILDNYNLQSYTNIPLLNIVLENDESIYIDVEPIFDEENQDIDEETVEIENNLDNEIKDIIFKKNDNIKFMKFINNNFFKTDSGINEEILRNLIDIHKNYLNDPVCKIGMDLIEFKDFNGEEFNILSTKTNQKDEKLIGMINSVNKNIYCFILEQEMEYWKYKLDTYIGFISKNLEEYEISRNKYYKENLQPIKFMNFSYLSSIFYILENLSYLNFSDKVNNIFLYIPTKLRWVDFNSGISVYHNKENIPIGDIVYLIVPFNLFD